MNLPLEEYGFYHIYNRANGSEKIFVDADNYRYFMTKYQQYISPIAETYCYCLMPNHFHFLVKIKSEKEVRAALAGGGESGVGGSSNAPGLKDLGRLATPGFKNLGRLADRADWPLEKVLSKQLSNFFNAYAKAFNKQQKRMGSLFIKNFKRKRVKDMNYMKNLVQYIHNNPVEAKMVLRPEDYPHSSYITILNEDEAFLRSNEVLEWYFVKDNFICCHKEKKEMFVEED